VKTTTRLAVVAALACLTGCAALQDAGHSAYTVRPVTDQHGKVQGYTLDVQDGKEYAQGRMVQFQTAAEGATLMLQEGPSKAFKGQAISAKAAAVFPITDLANILTGGARE
jgi:hypothetical protein